MYTYSNEDFNRFGINLDKFDHDNDDTAQVKSEQDKSENVTSKENYPQKKTKKRANPTSIPKFTPKKRAVNLCQKKTKEPKSLFVVAKQHANEDTAM